MIIELFEGNPAALAARLTALIAMPKTINFVVLTHEKGKYIIAYT